MKGGSGCALIPARRGSQCEWESRRKVKPEVAVPISLALLDAVRGARASSGTAFLRGFVSGIYMPLGERLAHGRGMVQRTEGTGQGGVQCYGNWEKWFSRLGSQTWFGQIIHKWYWSPAMVWLGWKGRWRMGCRLQHIWLVCLRFVIVIVLRVLISSR